MYMTRCCRCNGDGGGAGEVGIQEEEQKKYTDKY